jgi:molybdate transport system permease protein
VTSRRSQASERGTGGAPLPKGADSDARADARERDTSPGLAVVAGDTISPPRRPGPAPWWAPATEIRRAVRPGGDRAPFGFVPLAVVAVVFLTLPLVALLVRAPWRSLPGDLTAPGVLTALRLSIVCSVGALCLSLVFGVPLAWLLARVRFRGRNLVRALVLLPMVLPPVVGGVALLLAFGRNGLAGQWLDRLFGITLPFSTAGAMLAETFVAMPFLVITVEAGIRAMDRRYEDAAATLGAGRWRTFRLVTLPLIAPALLAGGALCWARALGEFGATITFAGNLPGTTQTMPLAVYLALQNNVDAAITLSLVMLAISLAVLVGLRSHWFPSR